MVVTMDKCVRHSGAFVCVGKAHKWWLHNAYDDDDDGDDDDQSVWSHSMQ